MNRLRNFRQAAAWRYGDTFGERRRRTLVTFASISVFAGFLGPFGGRAIGMAALGAPLMQLSISFTAQLIRASRLKVLINDQAGRRRQLSLGEKISSRFAVDRAIGELTLTITSRDGVCFDSIATRSWQRIRSLGKFAADKRLDIELSGQTAVSALSNMLPTINSVGGEKKQIDAAVSIVGHSPKPQSILWNLPQSTSRTKRQPALAPRSFFGVDPALRLALEMSLHEQDERRAMEGELKELEARWKEAEEIAAIADSLTLPAETASRLGELKHAKSVQENRE